MKKIGKNFFHSGAVQKKIVIFVQIELENRPVFC